jgi:hypothetical protein
MVWRWPGDRRTGCKDQHIRFKDLEDDDDSDDA